MNGSLSAVRHITATSFFETRDSQDISGHFSDLFDNPEVGPQKCRYRVDADGRVVGADCGCDWCQDSDDVWGES